MVLEFYYDLVSSGCRAVYLLLKEGGVPFEPKLTELQKGKTAKFYNMYVTCNTRSVSLVDE